MSVFTASEIRDFWLRRKGWPEMDYPGTLFLGRAICRVGAARYGSDWTGLEPIAFVPPPIEPLTARLWGGRPLPSRSPPPDPEQHRQKMQARECEIAVSEKAVARWNEVHKTMWTWLIDGRLEFALRWPGGQMQPGNPLEWNAEKAGKYLTDCHLPFVGDWTSAYLPVFVSADGLAACLKPSALAGGSIVATETMAVAALTTLFRDNKSERIMTNPALKLWVESDIGRHLTSRQFERAKAAAARDAEAPVWIAGGAPKGARGPRSDR